jgi:hypothetical protein
VNTPEGINTAGCIIIILNLGAVLWNIGLELTKQI